MKYFLELCIKSVESAISTIEAEIIVVDNNSSDGSCLMVKQFFPKVKLIENKKNLGFSKGNNIGVSKATGEYICILNPDTVVAEDTFLSILNFATKQTNLGIVGCKLIDGTGQFLPESKRNIPIVKVALKKILGNSKKYYSNHLNEDTTGNVDVLVGAFMFVKRNIFNQVNGFDEDYFMYGEDIDLSYRILKAKYSNYYFAKTTIIHFKGESTLKDKFYAKRFYRAMQIFYTKHFKSNIMFDIIVWLGIKMAYIVRNKQKSYPENATTYYLISDTSNSDLETKLGNKIVLKSIIEDVDENAEIIFDAAYLSYKEIIKNLSQLSVNKKLTFKILPNNSSFLVGSNNSFSQGEVICFDKN